MRLFRRSLLCLVVGVTAFGAAGWGFRPRANWSTTLEPARFASLIDRRTSSGDAPQWVYLYFNQSENIAVAVDPQTGARLNEIRVDGNLYRGPTAIGDGRLLVRMVSPPRGSDDWNRPIDATEFKIFNAVDRAPVSACRLVGDWAATDDGLHAWTAKLENETLTCTVADVATGQTLHRRQIEGIKRKGPNGQHYCAVSALEWSRLYGLRAL
jgi:hypothetical protein